MQSRFFVSTDFDDSHKGELKDISTLPPCRGLLRKRRSAIHTLQHCETYLSAVIEEPYRNQKDWSKSSLEDEENVILYEGNITPAEEITSGYNRPSI